MPKFGSHSMAEYETLDTRLQRIMDIAITLTDFSILKGERGEEEQNLAFLEGRTTLKWPHSKHNLYPEAKLRGEKSRAVDIAPYPIDWNDRARFYHLAGIIRGIGAAEGVRIRCGCDWDGDGRFDDQSFHDLPHIELMD